MKTIRFWEVFWISFFQSCLAFPSQNEIEILGSRGADDIFSYLCSFCSELGTVFLCQLDVKGKKIIEIIIFNNSLIEWEDESESMETCLRFSCFQIKDQKMKFPLNILSPVKYSASLNVTIVPYLSCLNVVRYCWVGWPILKGNLRDF